MAVESSKAAAEPSACPVNPKSRAWLDVSKNAASAGQPPPTVSSASSPSAPVSDAEPVCAPRRNPFPFLFPTPRNRPSSASNPSVALSKDRAVSTIPRNSNSPDDPDVPSPATRTDATSKANSSQTRGNDASACPANSEAETAPDAATGNWIYPSEEMFFNAMKRKNFSPRAEDMSSVVPIHNAVNERAWKEIREWEKGRGSEACGGPRLTSFRGDYGTFTPRARLNGILGYEQPFDRHDWVVDRCGKRIDYVIDFYAGKSDGKSGKSLNFYLDVRPKLNTWEGAKMRAFSLMGL